jgi:hypothetical protein
MNRAARLLFVACLMVGATGLGLAQNTNSGDIRGTATDSSGAVLPGVAVSVTNVDNGTTKDFVTNNDGIYDTASILPGRYQITFVKDGFQKLVRGPITLQVGSITVDGSLKVGSITQEVLVTTEVPLLKTEDAEQSTTFDSKTLMNLPQVSPNGQNWGSFAQLLPGAAGSPTQPTAAGSTGDPGIAIAVNGNLPFYDNFLQDGASTNLPISANVDIATFETISELRISTSNFSAEYGIGGAVFNQITKSGTNRFHGAGYEYFGSDQFNAQNYNFTGVPQTKSFLRYHNFGGAVGGPILKNKLFFYFNLDKVINNGTSFGTATVPTLAMRAGDFSNMPTIYDPSTQPAGCVGAACARSAFANNKIANIDPVANALQAYFPVPNVPGTAATGFSGEVQNNYYFHGPQKNPFLKFFGRIDYSVSDKNRLNFSITQRDNPGVNTNQQVCPINCFSGDVDSYNTQISDVYSFSPRTINEARFGYTRQGNWFVPFTFGKGYPQKVGLQYSKADVFPQMNINGGNFCCGGDGGILQPGTNAIYIENTFEPSDVVTMVRGKHILHFGGELLDYQANFTPWGNVQSGQFNFSGVYTQQNPTATGTGSAYADFLLGDVNSWTVNNQPESGMRMKSPQFFVQDDVKVRPNLTVNLGLRYEIQGGWSEVKNHLGAFDPTIVNALTGTPGAMWFAGQTSRTTLQSSVNDVFLPRVGFAWNPGGSTVVRGGFGMYAFTWSMDTYGQGVGLGSNSSGNANDTTNGAIPVTALSGPGINLQTGQPLPYLAASTSSTAYNGQSEPYNQYHTPVPKMYQWTVSLEHQLGTNLEGEIAYVGSHGSHLDFPVDINQVPVSKLSPTDTAADRPYPQFQGLSGNTNNAISNYNSLQLQIQKRLSRGLTFSANYTWSHFLDDQDSAGWGSRGGSQPYQDAYHPSANYGSSNFDVRHAVKGSVVYNLPVGRGRQFLSSNTFLDAIIGGWQTSATFVAHSGQPFTAVAGSNNSDSLSTVGNAAQYLNVIGDPHLSHPTIQNWYNTAAFAQPAAGTFGNERRNSLLGPGLSEVDFSVGKNFTIKEGIALQIRADAYNILNHPSFGLPNIGGCTGNSCNPSISFNSSGAPTTVPSISSTTIGPRQIQLNARISF